MDKEKALDFLRRHQPLPDDKTLNETPNLIKEYNEVRQYFEAHPDKQAIPLLLNSFGDGSGFGLYQLVEDAIIPFPAEEVVPHLVQVLSSKYQGVRYWAAQVAMSFPSPQLLQPLQKILQEDNSDGRTAAASSLAFIQGEGVDEILRQALNSEQDNDIREFITQVLEDRGSRAE